MDKLLEYVFTGGLSVAVIGILGKIVDYWIDLRKKKTPVSNEIVKIAEAYKVLRDSLENSDIERAMILKTENNGGKPKMGCNLYTSAIYDAVKPPMEYTADKYQRLLIDGHYTSLIADVATKSVVHVVTKDLPDHTLLKNIYLVSNIKSSKVFYLHETPNAFFYVSFATTKDADLDSPHNALKMQLAISAIKQLFT